MAVKEKKIIFFQDVTATLGDGLAWIAPIYSDGRDRQGSRGVVQSQPT